jgi:ubiquinone/menaquinone biosynthesis C-methylase UbiE
MIKSASHYSTNEKIFSLLRPLIKESAKILDFGAGKGHMVERIGEHAKLVNVKPSELIFP